MNRLLGISVAGLLAGSVATRADIITETYGPDLPGADIADNQAVLTSFLHRVSNSQIQSLTEVRISFELTGASPGSGFASDVFASLLKSPLTIAPSVSDPASILLNRVGVSDSDATGYGFDGWNMTLGDTAPTDIHQAHVANGVLTGFYQPDGRLDPLDTSRIALLQVFNGGKGNGDWWLNIGDLAQSGTMRLVGWSLTLTGDNGIQALPEATSGAAACAVTALAVLILWSRHRRHP